jgi:hypothetical protein
VSARAVTLIISPLLAIEQDQAEELVKRFSNSYKPFCCQRQNKHVYESPCYCARRIYTHVWVSAEIVLGGLLVEGRSSARRTKRTYDDGYCDSGTFTSVVQDTVFQERLLQLLPNPIGRTFACPAGFDPQLQSIRTSVYRSDVFLCMLPTDNPTDIFKKTLYTAMEESRDGEVPKMIFFVHDTWIQ